MGVVQISVDLAVPFGKGFMLELGDRVNFYKTEVVHRNRRQTNNPIATLRPQNNSEQIVEKSISFGG